ncbi:MAG: hypothetical protein Q8M11_07695 [Sulfuritalea sp.]|nr:hypothetical protein [Sulfuritalea sp.]
MFNVIFIAKSAEDAHHRDVHHAPTFWGLIRTMQNATGGCPGCHLLRRALR